MKSLIYLVLTKFKGTIRNQFRTVTSAIVTILLVLTYGALFVMAFLSSKEYMAESMRLSTNVAILAGLGIIGLMSITVLVQKRKALVFDIDAFYLFAGPYSRKQVNAYIMIQTFWQSLLYGFLGCFIMAMVSIESYFSVPLFLLALLVFALAFGFFMLATDYIYMWSLVDKKHKRWNYVLAAVILLWVGVVLFFSMKKTGFQMEDGLAAFALSEDFYYIPLFGWAKWTLSSFLEGRYLNMLPGILLLIAANTVFVIFFLRFKENIVEQAVRDAEEVSEIYRKAKANKGSTVIDNKKLKKVKGEFPEGAKAIFHKNFLVMRKTGNFLRKQDIFIIVFYFIISYISAPKDFRFYLFAYMMVIWLFTLLNDVELLGDLKNYQIYLIPENPLKKLIYAILPAYIKIAIVISASVIFAGIFNKMPVVSVVQYVVMLLGYGMIFISGTVLSTRILKSRTNMMAENLLRMLIILLSAVPSTVVGGLIFIFFKDLNLLMTALSVITVVMNFIISGLIIVLCQGMMNGREL